MSARAAPIPTRRPASGARSRPPPPGCWRPLGAAARLCGVDGVPSGRVHDALRAARAADAGELRARLGRGAVRALLPQHLRAGDDDPRRASSCSARSRPTRSRASTSAAAMSRSRWCWLQLMIMPDVLIVENYRTMSALGLRRHDPGDRAALCRVGLRHLPAAPDLQDGAEGARRRGARRRRERRCRCCCKVYVPLARPVYLAYGARLGELPLEQFPLAADRHQLGRGAPADRRPAGVLVGRSGHRLVDHLAPRR